MRIPIIDPDAEARKINPFAPESAAVAAGRQAIQLGRDYLKNKQSFAVETTLSGNTYINIMQRAKQEGYEINLIFVGIDDVNMNVKRVKERVVNGGHNVPEEDIRRRYGRAMENLPVALELADNTTIFDNSTNLGHQQKLTIENKKLTQQSEDLPQWIVNSIPQEKLRYLQNESIAQSIYPLARNIVEANRSRLEEVSTGIFKLEDTNYQLIVNEDKQQLSIFRRSGNSQELACYDTLNGSLVSTKGLTKQDENNWNIIQTTQQNYSQTNMTTEDTEL